MSAEVLQATAKLRPGRREAELLWTRAVRPVHPEWRERIPHAPGSTVGVALNPDWIGISVLENVIDPALVSALAAAVSAQAPIWVF